jgi:hypothetical protein
LLRVINGGIYNVTYNGTDISEFCGEHPSIIVRTLKEKEIYLVVPLTSILSTEANLTRFNRI